jgi:hypothetical protein
VPRNRKPSEPTDIQLAKQALIKERAADGARAAVDYQAAQDAQRTKTARLRALRLAKEAEMAPVAASGFLPIPTSQRWEP